MQNRTRELSLLTSRHPACPTRSGPRFRTVLDSSRLPSRGPRAPIRFSVPVGTGARQRGQRVGLRSSQLGPSLRRSLTASRKTPQSRRAARLTRHHLVEAHTPSGTPGYASSDASKDRRSSSFSTYRSTVSKRRASFASGSSRQAIPAEAISARVASKSRRASWTWLCPSTSVDVHRIWTTARSSVWGVTGSRVSPASSAGSDHEADEISARRAHCRTCRAVSRRVNARACCFVDALIEARLLGARSLPNSAANAPPSLRSSPTPRARLPHVRHGHRSATTELRRSTWRQLL